MLAAIPVIGGTITEVLSVMLAPAVARRRDQWFKELADGLEQLEANVEGFKFKNLEHDEEFVSAVIEASRSAISTHKQEKREALRNAMLNIALHRSAGEDQQQTFLRYIDELTAWHLRILALFQDPPRGLATKGIQVNPSVGGAAQILGNMYPELNGRREEIFRSKSKDQPHHRRGTCNGCPRSQRALTQTLFVQCVGMHKPVPFDDIYEPTALFIKGVPPETPGNLSLLKIG